MIDFERDDPQALAEADLGSLMEALRAVKRWTPRKARVLDYVYRHRVIALLRRAREEDELVPLAEHLRRATHSIRRDKLDALDLPYAARWQAYEAMLESGMSVLRAESWRTKVHSLARSPNGRAVLERLREGEVARQKDLEKLLGKKPSYLSQLLDEMESHGLVQRERAGREKRVAIGPVGKEEIGLSKQKAAASAAAMSR
jgi:predicted transcriptional regulator